VNQVNYYLWKIRCQPGLPFVIWLNRLRKESEKAKRKENYYFRQPVSHFHFLLLYYVWLDTCSQVVNVFVDMKSVKLKQFAVSLLALLSLFASSVSACACSHHQEKPETNLAPVTNIRRKQNRTKSRRQIIGINQNDCFRTRMFLSSACAKSRR